MLDIAIMLGCLAGLVLLFHEIYRVRVEAIEMIEKPLGIHKTKHLNGPIQAHQDLNGLLNIASPLSTQRDWVASPELLLVIARHALRAKPSNVVESCRGASARVLARCKQLRDEGHTFSLERDPKLAVITRSDLNEAGFSDLAPVLDGRLKTQADHTDHRCYDVPALAPASTIDVLLVDSLITHFNWLVRHPAAPILQTLLATPCQVFLGDDDREDGQETVRQWGAEYSEKNLAIKRPTTDKGCTHLVHQQ